MTEKRQIARQLLTPGAWYVGRGRSGNVGRWDGECFDVITDCLLYNGNFNLQQQTIPGVKFETYFTVDEGSFQPFSLIKPDDSLHCDCISVNRLQLKRFYVCPSSGFTVGRWNGQEFNVLHYNTSSASFERPEIVTEKHINEGGRFNPAQLVEEGIITLPYKENGLTAGNYAELIRFG